MEIEGRGTFFFFFNIEMVIFDSCLGRFAINSRKITKRGMCCSLLSCIVSTYISHLSLFNVLFCVCMNL